MKTKKEIFLRRVDMNGGWASGMETQCWIYPSKQFNMGDGRIVNAQRASYEFFIGELPTRVAINKLCGSKFCVNPGHLVVGERSLSKGDEECRDGVRYKKCPKCKIWFEKTEDNFYVNANGIYLACKSCQVKTVQKSRVSNWARVLWYEAKRRNLATDGELVTVADIMKIYEQQGGRCYWSGILMEPSTVSKYPAKPSLDRLDRFKGYTKDNVVLCCLALNIGRNSSSKATFEAFMQNLKNIGIQNDLWR